MIAKTLKPFVLLYIFAGCDLGGGRRHPVGHFIMEGKCTKKTCFCNQNGEIDCPSWMSENTCQTRKYKDPVIKRPPSKTWGSKKNKIVLIRPKPKWNRKV